MSGYLKNFFYKKEQGNNNPLNDISNKIETMKKAYAENGRVMRHLSIAGKEIEQAIEYLKEKNNELQMRTLRSKRHLQ